MARNCTIQWEAAAVTVPATSFAEFTVVNGRIVNAFDASAGESIILEGILPAEYTGSGTLKLRLLAMANYNGSGASADLTGILDISGEFITPDVGELGSADSFNTSTDTGTITFDDVAYEVHALTVTLTDTKSDESPAAGDLFRIKVTRDVASDDLSVDLLVFAYELFEEV